MPATVTAIRTSGVTEKELTRRQQHDLVNRPHTALVGRVESAQRLDLIAEPLDPDGEWLTGREDVDNAAPTGELAAAGNLGKGLVAEVDELAQDPFL